VIHFYEETETAFMGAPDFDTLGLSTHARRLSTAIQHANKEIIEIAKTSDRRQGMGTTIVAAHFAPRSSVMHLGYVGDSRCYRFRDSRLEPLTQDHSLLNDVLELRPDISDDDAKRIPRNVITRALGMSANVRATIRSYEIVPSDVYLMCSDGLTDVLGDDEILDTLEASRDADAMVRALVERAKLQGADDNIAVVAIACDLPPGSLPLSRRSPARLRMPKRELAPALRPSQPMAVHDDSSPEIIIVGQDPRSEEDETVVQVLPADSASQDALDVVTDIVEPRRPPPFKPRPMK
jgi:protein phosphatase